MRYGAPISGSAGNLTTQGLDALPSIRNFASTVGAGVFADGLISVASVRECELQSLFGWEQHLPTGARVFACSAFGTLFATLRDVVWVVDTQYGIVTESTETVLAFFGVLAESQTSEGLLRSALFREWLRRGGILPTDSVLCPRPALALGGEWHANALAPMSLPVYLLFTAGLFAAGDNAVILQRVSNG